MEGAELEVLQGMTDADWEKVDQVCITDGVHLTSWLSPDCGAVRMHPVRLHVLFACCTCFVTCMCCECCSFVEQLCGGGVHVLWLMSLMMLRILR